MSVWAAVRSLTVMVETISASGAVALEGVLDRGLELLLAGGARGGLGEDDLARAVVAAR